MADPRATTFRCPDCSTPLVIKPGSVRTWDGLQLRCIFCASAWEHEPHRRASDRYLALAGTGGIFVFVMLATAMWSGASAVCVEKVASERETCVQRPVVASWEHAGSVISLGLISAIAVVSLISYAVGSRMLREYWWRLAQGASLLGIGAGVASGLWLTRQAAADVYWEPPHFWTDLVSAGVTTTIAIWLIGLAATGRALRDPSRWVLVQVYPDLEEGNFWDREGRALRWHDVPPFHIAS